MGERLSDIVGYYKDKIDTIEMYREKNSYNRRSHFYRTTWEDLEFIDFLSPESITANDTYNPVIDDYEIANKEEYLAFFFPSKDENYAEPDEIFLIAKMNFNNHTEDDYFPIVESIPDENTITKTTLAEALYLVNKEAKNCRDIKKQCFQNCEHKEAHIAKSKELAMYCLKEETLSKLESNNEIVTLSYHKSGDTGQYLRLVKIVGVDDFTFHIPCEKYDVPLEERETKEIDIITAEVSPEKATMPLEDAISILIAFTGVENGDINEYRDRKNEEMAYIREKNKNERRNHYYDDEEDEWDDYDDWDDFDQRGYYDEYDY